MYWYDTHTIMRRTRYMNEKENFYNFYFHFIDTILLLMYTHIHSYIESNKLSSKLAYNWTKSERWWITLIFIIVVQTQTQRKKLSAWTTCFFNNNVRQVVDKNKTNNSYSPPLFSYNLFYISAWEWILLLFPNKYIITRYNTIQYSYLHMNEVLKKIQHFL